MISIAKKFSVIGTLIGITDSAFFAILSSYLFSSTFPATFVSVPLFSLRIYRRQLTHVSYVTGHCSVFEGLLSAASLIFPCCVTTELKLPYSY